MSTFLELCQDALTESGSTSISIPSVKSQTGLPGKFVRWTRRAWIDIQVEQRWRFMRATKTLKLTQSQGDYSLATLGWTDIRELENGKRAQLITRDGGVSELRLLSAEDWREQYAGRTIGDGLPAVVMRDGDLLRFTPASSAAADTVSLSYWKTPQVLTENADLPIGLADDLHAVISWRALYAYGKHDVAQDIRDNAKEEANRLLSRMFKLYMPEFKFSAAPLDAAPYWNPLGSRPK